MSCLNTKPPRAGTRRAHAARPGTYGSCPSRDAPRGLTFPDCNVIACHMRSCWTPSAVDSSGSTQELETSELSSPSLEFIRLPKEHPPGPVWDTHATRYAQLDQRSFVPTHHLAGYEYPTRMKKTLEFLENSTLVVPRSWVWEPANAHTDEWKWKS